MYRITKNSLLNGRSGAALITVLSVILILTILTVEITFSSRINAKITSNLRDSTKAFYLAKSGINMSLLRIKMDSIAHQMFSQYIGKSDNQSEFWWTVPLMYPLGSEMFGELLEEADIDKSKLDSYGKSQDIGGSFVAEIYDESLRININDIQLSQETPSGAYLMLQNLLSTPRFAHFFRYKNKEEIVNKIVDWIDPNSEVAGIGGGIEDSDYFDYRVKNNSFFAPTELKLIAGVDADLYAALSPYIAVFPYSVPQSTVPLGRINVNDAPREIIASIFDQNVVDNAWEISKTIVKARDEGTVFGSKDEFIKFLEDKFSIDPKAEQKAIPRAIENIIDTRTDYFRIVSTGVVNDTESTITTVVKRNGKETTTVYWRVN